MSLQQTIGLVLAFMFIILSVVIITGLLNMFTGPPDQGTVNVYNKIYDSIETMMNPANQDNVCKIVPAYIKPDFAIVGFNKEGQRNADGKTGDKGDEDWGYVEEQCGIVDDNIYKPMACLDSACICLCTGGTGDVSGDDCKESESICRRVSKDIKRFTTRHGEATKDLVLYGESCWGSDHHVIAGYVIKKEQGGESISIEEVMTNEEMDSDYPGAPECEVMVRQFSRGAPEPEKEGEAEKDVITPEMERIKKESGGIAVST